MKYYDKIFLQLHQNIDTCEFLEFFYSQFSPRLESLNAPLLNLISEKKIVQRWSY